MAIIGVDSEVAWHEWDPVYYHFQCKLGMLLDCFLWGLSDELRSLYATHACTT